jgi:anaerobic dimethyl sulfoxide reductase subunit C (anchor subunit)
MDIQWPLVIFSLLAGGGAATLAFAGISEFTGGTKKVRFVVGIIALALMVVGGIASVFHLGQPGNFMQAIANLGSFSGVSLELIFLGLSIVVGIIYIFTVRAESAASKGVGAVGIILALIFGFITGHSYQITAQTTWDNFGLAFSYLTSALTLGGFLYLTTVAALKEDTASLKTPGIIAVVCAALQLISFFAFAAFAGFDKTDILSFWLCAVVIGSLVPIIAGAAFAFKGGQVTLVYLGFVGALIGGLAIRIFMWQVGGGFLNFFQEALLNRSLFPL